MKYIFKETKDSDCEGCHFNNDDNCSQPTSLNCCNQAADFGIWILEEDMEESRELKAMRSMAWERAKGELRSMEHTFYSGNGTFDKFNEAVTEFIKYVEDEGLQE